MGKKQHQQDKLYLTSNEWKHFYGGKKTDTSSAKDAHDFRRLPFHCCSLTFQPFKHPYCSRQGHVFDLESIAPFIKRYGRNPITGESLEAKTLVKMHFHKNAKDQFHCPITFKIFNESTHIVCIATSGNVFAYDAIEQLNLKVNYMKDLLTDEAFAKKDIITIQDPNNLAKFDMSKFYYLRENLKWESDDSQARLDPQFFLKTLSSEAASTLDELKRTYVPATTSTSSSNYQLARQLPKADSVNAAPYSTGRVAASFTSTVMEIVTNQQAAVIDENEVRWSRVHKLAKKGYVCLVTNYGRLNIELFCDQVPRACENFMKLCADKYYKDTLFHRLIKNFMIQGGDPTGTGTGGQSTWNKPFDDEFKPNLSHSGRGVLSMANSGPNTNKSQFFITFRSCPHLDNVHTVFGKVVGGLDVLSKMEAVEVDKKERPKVSIKIDDCLVFVDPYKEVDEQIKRERESASKRDDKASLDAAEAKKKSALDELKCQRPGVGKYISATLLDKKHKVTAADEEDRSELKIKKMKVALSVDKADFSSW